MAQPNLAFSAEPLSISSLLLLETQSAFSSFSFSSSHGLIFPWKVLHCQSRKILYPTPPCFVSSTVILGKLKGSEVFDVMFLARIIHFIQDKRICNGYSKQKTGDILIKFTTSKITLMISTKLITTIHSTHVLAILCNSYWTRNFLSTPIFLATKNCINFGRIIALAITFTIFLSNHADAITLSDCTVVF